MVFPSPVGAGSGEEAVPPPQKIFEIFLAENGAFLLHFLPYTRFFSAVQRGGGMAQVAQW